MELRKVLRVPKGRADVINALLHGIELDANAGGTWHVRSGSSMRAPKHLVQSGRVAEHTTLSINRTGISLVAAQNGDGTTADRYPSCGELLAAELLPEQVCFEVGAGWKPDTLSAKTILELCHHYVGQGFSGLLKFSTAGEDWVCDDPRADVDIGFCHEPNGSLTEPHWNFVMITATGADRQRLGPVLRACQTYQLVEHVPVHVAAA